MIGGGINSLRAAVANNVGRTANFLTNDAVRNKLVVGEDGGLTLLTGVPKESLKEKVANGALDWGTILLSVAGGPEGMLTAQGGRSPTLKGFEEVKDAVKTVHGNSKLSTKPQHTYDIVNTHSDNDVVKTGISGSKLNQNGTSRRANSQAKKWNENENSPGKYKGVVTGTHTGGTGARQKALDSERDRAKTLLQEGQLNDPQKHVRPR
ncbi:hypothetical protein WH221_22385 [Chryseobacterium culicis]|uniref:Uncharacterized protein n=1 Tax=Chryseobacterium culicis TaxID=680127 RepID=A0A2S9CHU1_CHRCI|nr:hypothetical protein [Chryseobacterium culicis]PRB80081.1 hypothetical protein CQ022_22310 [Chryseobacterium culicis]PRB87285.1 hypothetical protein CQ033_22655 [Chryseobacterium culicis]